MAKQKKKSPASGGKKKSPAATILWAAAALAGGLGLGTLAEAVFEPKNAWGAAALNGGTAGVSSGLMSLAVPRKSKVMVPLVNGGLALAGGAALSAVGLGQKAAEWKDKLLAKLGMTAADASAEKDQEAVLAAKAQELESKIRALETQRQQASQQMQPQVTVVHQAQPKTPQLWERILGSVVESGLDFAKQAGLKAMSGTGAARQLPRLARVF